jgi:hypothetical protein
MQQQWEYLTVPIATAIKPDVATAQLNELGAQGWELVNVFAFHAFLKRRKG